MNDPDAADPTKNDALPKENSGDGKNQKPLSELKAFFSGEKTEDDRLAAVLAAEFETVKRRRIWRDPKSAPSETLNRGGESNSLPEFERSIPKAGRSELLQKLLSDLSDKDQENRWTHYALGDETQKLSESELAAIVADKTKPRETKYDPRSKLPTHAGLVGLAFSGGGIRSATFNLGVVQSLIRMGIFNCVDYLSTVSGGGYLGASLSAIFAKFNPSSAQKGDSNKSSVEVETPARMPFLHEPDMKEGAAFRHLRNNSQYLAPDTFSDFVRIPAVLLRGIVINILSIYMVLLPIAALGWLFFDRAKGLWETFALSKLGCLIFLGAVLIYPWSAFVKSWRVRSLKWLPKTSLAWLRKWISLDYDPDDPDFAKKMRADFESVLIRILIGTGIVFFIELQPHLMTWLKPFLEHSETSLRAWLSGLGGATAGGILFSEFLAKRIQRLVSKFALTLLGLVGVAFIWLSFLATATLPAVYPSWGVSVADMHFSLPTLYLWLALGLLALLLPLDINKIGMHNFYRDRLSRAYIFFVRTLNKKPDYEAARKLYDDQTQPRETVENCDSLKLHELSEEIGPYHLINATLNTRTANQAYQKGRLADFFIFSKHYCGSELTGYCQTKELEKLDSHINLATAMAISGAAAAPNMGRDTNRFLAVLLSLLNVRLNYWMVNPKRVIKKSLWDRIPVLNQFSILGSVFLFREMLGRMTGDQAYVSISDGGHLDNSGIYPLLQRQCRLIIFGDGEADGKYEFEALSEVIRMAQIDLGITIVMDGLDEIREGHQSWAYGTIYYNHGREGRLVYLKSSLNGDYNLESSLKDREAYLSSSLRDDNRLYDENVYIANYKARNPGFPHESTADQFFSEKQFEAYRALGVRVTKQAFGKCDLL